MLDVSQSLSWIRYPNIWGLQNPSGNTDRWDTSWQEGSGLPLERQGTAGDSRSFFWVRNVSATWMCTLNKKRKKKRGWKRFLLASCCSVSFSLCSDLSVHVTGWQDGCFLIHDFIFNSFYRKGIYRKLLQMVWPHCIKSLETISLPLTGIFFPPLREKLDAFLNAFQTWAIHRLQCARQTQLRPGRKRLSHWTPQ